MKNLILIGMPGCGKSTVGVLCAKALGMPFLDTDLVLQSRSGKLLQSLVDELGTEGFLRLEEEVILGIACEGTVLATGGSVALEDRAIAHLRRTGVSVYLRLPYAEIEHRLRNIATRGIAMGRHYRDLVEGKCFFHEFLNLGHVMFLEDPEQFNRTVLEFVEQYA